MITKLTFKPTSKRHGLVEISYSNGSSTILETVKDYCESVAMNDGIPWVAPNEWRRG